jgi:hypothetical protein
MWLLACGVWAETVLFVTFIAQLDIVCTMLFFCRNFGNEHETQFFTLTPVIGCILGLFSIQLDGSDAQYCKIFCGIGGLMVRYPRLNFNT